MRNIKGYFLNTWVLNNPRLVLRSLRGFARAFFLRKNSLKAIEIFPTMNCNLHCKMCSIEKYKHSQRHPLGPEDYERIAKQGAKLGAL